MDDSGTNRALDLAFSLVEAPPFDRSFPFKENAKNLSSDDNNMHGGKRLSSSGDGKENLPTVTENEGSLISEELQQVKKKRKDKGYNLRKSLAWNRAFFTEEGFLDQSELSLFNGKFNQSRSGHQFSLEKTSGSGNMLGSSNLETLEEEILEESDTRNGESGVSCKPVSVTPKNVPRSPASKKKIAIGKTHQLGVHPRLPASNSQKTQVHSKTTSSASSTSKSRAGSSMSLNNSTTEKKHINDIKKNVGIKLSAPRTIVDTRSHVAPNVSKIHAGKNYTKGIAARAAISEEKNKKLTLKSRPGLDSRKASCEVGQTCNRKDENVIHPSSMSTSHSALDTNSGDNLHGGKAKLRSGMHPLGNSQSLDNSWGADAVNTGSMLNLALLEGPTTLPSHSNVGIPHLDTKSTSGKFVPTIRPKPSGLRMPSPTMGFFHQVKTSDVHIQAHKNSLASIIGSHAQASERAICPSEVRKLNHGCIPSVKGIKPFSKTVVSQTTQILTAAVSSSPFHPERLKLEKSSDVTEEVNDVTDSQALMKSGTPDDSNVLNERKTGCDKSVKRNMTSEKDQGGGCACESVSIIGQHVNSSGSQLLNLDKHLSDENNVDTLTSFHSEVDVQHDTPLARLDAKSGSHDGDCDTCHSAFPSSGRNQVACFGDQVLAETIPIDMSYVQYGCENLTRETLVSSESVDSDFEFSGKVAQVLESEKQIDAGIHFDGMNHDSKDPSFCVGNMNQDSKDPSFCVDNMNQDSKDPSFRDLPIFDSCSISVRKRMRRSSDSMPNGCLEESTQVAVITNSSDSQQCTESLCSRTTEGNQEQLSVFVSLQNESTCQQTETESIERNCSSSCWESAVPSCLSLFAQLPVSEEKVVADNDNAMKINDEQIFDLDSDSVMYNSTEPGNTTFLDEGRMNYGQRIPLLVDSSSDLPSEEESGSSLATNIMLDSVCENSKPNHSANFDDEMYLDIGSGVLSVAKLSVESLAAATHAEDIKEIPTYVSKGEPKVVDLTVQHDTNNSACSEQTEGTEIPKNLSDCLKQESMSMKHPINVEPFSDEWIAALEAAGEDVLKRKTGAVQHSPPDKVLPEPGPWSPVKRNSQDLGPFDCTKYTGPAANSD